MEMIIENAGKPEMKLISRYVNDFRLDGEELKKDQFIIAKNDLGEFLGFGRLRNHADSLELCTLGVLPEHRGKGVGKKLVHELKLKANSDLYLVCIIPDFFKKFGFKITANAPSSIKRKLNICTTKLAVEEPYFIMKAIE